MLEPFSLDLNNLFLVYYISAIMGKAVQCPLRKNRVWRIKNGG
jgi:hypothetical protein